MRVAIKPDWRLAMSAVHDEPIPDAPSPPDEIRADYEFRVGEFMTMKASARVTPAGIISAGIAAAAIILAIGFLVSSTGGRRSKHERDKPDRLRLRDTT